jgi:hypothetical protein
MASKKNDIEKALGKIGENARAVGKAAESLSKEWRQTLDDVNEADKAFGDEVFQNKENFVDFLRSKIRNGKTEIRVMQVGPDGLLTDVSDKVNAKDLKPEDISGIQTENGRTIPIGQSREAAYRLLQELLTSASAASQFGTSESIRRMELVLAESDKILEHWKK